MTDGEKLDLILSELRELKATVSAHIRKARRCFKSRRWSQCIERADSTCWRMD